MNGETLRRSVVIRNPHGFHVRPAAVFAETAGRYQSRVALIHGEKRVDGRRVLDLLMLGAEAGAEVTLEVEGPDARDALEVLAELLGAAEPPALPPPPAPKKG
jgi:phosphotransferase system HPr (HPr) family protein